MHTGTSGLSLAATTQFNFGGLCRSIATAKINCEVLIFQELMAACALLSKRRAR